MQPRPGAGSATLRPACRAGRRSGRPRTCRSLSRRARRRSAAVGPVALGRPTRRGSWAPQRHVADTGGDESCAGAVALRRAGGGPFVQAGLDHAGRLGVDLFLQHHRQQAAHQLAVVNGLQGIHHDGQGRLVLGHCVSSNTRSLAGTRKASRDGPLASRTDTRSPSRVTRLQGTRPHDTTSSATTRQVLMSNGSRVAFTLKGRVTSTFHQEVVKTRTICALN